LEGGLRGRARHAYKSSSLMLTSNLRIRRRSEGLRGDSLVVRGLGYRLGATGHAGCAHARRAFFGAGDVARVPEAAARQALGPVEHEAERPATLLPSRTHSGVSPRRKTMLGRGAAYTRDPDDAPRLARPISRSFGHGEASSSKLSKWRSLGISHRLSLFVDSDQLRHVRVHSKEPDLSWRRRVCKRPRTKPLFDGLSVYASWGQGE
jgi:hypothetical protein